LEPSATSHHSSYELRVVSSGRTLLDQEQVMQQELFQPWQATPPPGPSRTRYNSVKWKAVFNGEKLILCLHWTWQNCLIKKGVFFFLPSV